MVQSTPAQRRIGADENDLKNNRLGLMSQRQGDHLQQHIEHYQQRISGILKRTIGVSILVTFVIVILMFVRVLLLPIAVIMEGLLVGGMVYMTTDFNHFIQQLMMDKEAETVRIIKGRTSRYTLRSHPLYQTLRVEVQNYKVLDPVLLREFETGELYQLYVLPQSRVVIAAEKITESSAGVLQ